MNFFKDKRIMVTGGAGFLGSHLVDRLNALEAAVFVPRSPDFDLRREAEVERLFKIFPPDIVIHAAVDGGGIGYLSAHPGEVFYANVMMDTLVAEYSRRAKVEKFIGIGTVCSYPKFAPVPFREEDLWNGYPEETNGPYGLAKKMMLVQSQAYREQFGFNGIHLLLVNMYGPRDDFSLESSHVIPALIRKCIEARESGLQEIVCWGDGSPTREFLYVEDAAEAVLLAAEKYDSSEPVNIGTGSEIRVRDLVTLIARLVGFRGNISWDSSKPNGQPRRCLDVTRAEYDFGFRARTQFEEGLKRTVEWYREERVKKNGP